MSLFSFVWGALIWAVLAFLGTFGLLSIYEDKRYSETLPSPEEKKAINSLISRMAAAVAGIAVVIYAATKIGLW